MKNATELNSDDHMDEGESPTSTLESADDDDEDEYNVEKVLAEKLDPRDGQLKFLVKWEGYDLTKCTWEPEENFLHYETLETWHRTKNMEPEEKRFNWQEWDAEREREAELKEQRLSQKEKLQKRETGIHDYKDTSHNKGAISSIDQRSTEKDSHDRVEKHQPMDPNDLSGHPKGPPMNKLPTKKKSVTVRQQSSVASNPSVMKTAPKDKLPSINKQRESQNGGEAPKTPSHVRKPGNWVNMPLSMREKSDVSQKQAKREVSKNASEEDTSEKTKKSLHEKSNQRTGRGTLLAHERKSRAGTKSPTASLDDKTHHLPRPEEQIHSAQALDLEVEQGSLDLNNAATTSDSPDPAPNSPVEPHSFKCSLVWEMHRNAENQIKVEVELHGLSDGFAHHLSTLATPEQRITKFLSAEYVKRYFVGKIGLPLEHLPTTISGDDCSKLIDCLSFLRGVAVVLSETFSMLLIPPSFGKVNAVGVFGSAATETPEASFSACIYPPLKLHGEALAMSNIVTKSCDKMLEKVLGIKAILSDEDDFKPSQTKFVFIHPQDAFLETIDLKTLISQQDKEWKWQNGEELLSPQADNVLMEISYDRLADEFHTLGQAKIQLIFLIHASLRFTLHLLPHIANLRSIPSTRFYLYGTTIDHTEWLINCSPIRVFSGCDLIFLTSALLFENTLDIPGILSLIETKKTNMKLAVPSDIVEVLDAIILRGFSVAEGTREFLLGRDVEQIDLPPRKSRGLETECDALARFQNENYSNFRSLTALCSEYSPGNEFRALYTSIEIMTIAEFRQKLTNII